MRPFLLTWVIGLLWLSSSTLAVDVDELARFAFNIGIMPMMPEAHNNSTQPVVSPNEMVNQIIQSIPMYKLGLIKTLSGALLPAVQILMIFAVLLFAVAGTTAFICSFADCFESSHPHVSHHRPHFKKYDFQARPPDVSTLHSYSKTLDQSSDKFNSLD